MEIHPLQTEDILTLVAGFDKLGWNKPASLFEGYFNDQTEGIRQVWVAWQSEEIAGYVTLKWESEYRPFCKANIPEINDLNVFPPYRNQGIATALIEKCEEEALKKGDTIGLGVGLYDGYGNAQKRYVKMGYIPDGLGITYNNKRVNYDDQVTLDDDLVLWFTKKIR